MDLSHEYLERVYAGVLGKIIGVYLGRPFEGWKNDRIERELGEVNYYVHEKLGKELIVADDDISGTFTFIRALEDYDSGREITVRQIGQTWLNYIVENKTILWWGGLGNSTEHTAYLRLKNGIAAPQSGSIALNGKTVAEQIGSQIFIDGWAMVAPGDADLAASLAKRASSVSHDGEAIYGAQVVAVMESMAFVEDSINRLIDVALSYIPKESVIRRMIDDLRAFHAKNDDWRQCFADVMKGRYSYDHFGGGCHMVPNHGLIILALLYGNDDFQRSLMIANTCGWDTDCNSGNVGCLLGIKNGLKGIDAGPDWRSPVADRLYLPTADGGNAITDAATQALRLTNIARAMNGQNKLAPKNGARFHFILPGSVQGFVLDDSSDAARGKVHNDNGALAITFEDLAQGQVIRAKVATGSVRPAKFGSSYSLVTSPSIYPGQRLRASLRLNGPGAVTARVYLAHPGEKDALQRVYGPQLNLSDKFAPLEWIIPDCGGFPITEIGIELASESRASGAALVDYLTWDGEPNVTLRKVAGNASQQAWVNGVHQFSVPGEADFRIIQNRGRGLIIQGTRDWRNYRVSATLTPNLAKSFGLAARVQGMERYYALLLCDDQKLRLIRRLDGEHVLAEKDFRWELGQKYSFELRVTQKSIVALVNDKEFFKEFFKVEDDRLSSGAIGLVIEEGRVDATAAKVEPA